MTKTKLVIFDFGGVVHSLTIGSSLENIAKSFGIYEEEWRRVVGPLAGELSTGKINEQQFWIQLSDGLDKPIPNSWWEVWNKSLQGDKVYPEITGLVKRLKSKGINVVVLSNTIPPHAELIRKWGWYRPFDKVYLSYDLGFRKPDMRVYEFVLKDQHVKGAECVYVDDLEENLVPAGELGMKTVLAVNPKQVVKDVRKLVFG